MSSFTLCSVRDGERVLLGDGGRDGFCMLDIGRDGDCGCGPELGFCRPGDKWFRVYEGDLSDWKRTCLKVFCLRPIWKAS